MTSLGTQRRLPWEVILDLKKNGCFLHKKEERVFGTGELYVVGAFYFEEPKEYKCDLWKEYSMFGIR